jgi:hypothetical protein
MPDTTYDNGVTTGIVHAGSDDGDGRALAALAEKMERRHHGPHDTLVIFIPEGSAQDARDRVWRALGAAPTQDPGQFELEQATAYDDNIRRMFVGP